jgi:hypothetical protein
MAEPAAYCWPQSVLAGESVALHASAPDGRVDVEVVRDGAQPGVVWRSTPVEVGLQALPADAPARGCGWPVTLSIPVDESWPSGLYLVRLLPARATATSAWFVVRSAAPSPDGVLFVLAANTWNAYNDFGGTNLYTGGALASFARPLAPGFLTKPDGDGARVVSGAAYPAWAAEHGLSQWHGMAGWAGQERRFAAWTEAEGMRLDYAVNADLEAVGPDLLDGYRLVLSVGHDEYWTWAMRDTVEGFVAAGGHAAFLSGNTCYWQVRLDGPVMVAYKHRYEDDPVFGTPDAARTTTMWADPITGRPETALTGVSFTRGGYSRIYRSAPRGAGGYEVHRADHWLLAGTRLRRGDLLGAAPGVVGYECDGCDLALEDGLPVATGAGGTPAAFEVVATAPATPFDEDTTPLPLAPGGEYELPFHARRLLGADSPENRERLRHGHAVLGAYTRGGGAGTVVTVGCTDWAYGLDDPAVARVTRNVLALANPGQ